MEILVGLVTLLIILLVMLGGLALLVWLGVRLWRALTRERSPTSQELMEAFQLIPQMSGQQFEIFIARIFWALGYRVERIGAAGDQGVDLLVVTDEGRRIAIQCKNYKRAVGNSPVQEIYAGAAYHGAGEGWVVAPKGYTKGATELAGRLGINLFDERGIRAWISQVDIDPASQQGKTDRENYTRLLEGYREHLDLLESLYESRDQGESSPDGEQDYREGERELRGSLREIEEALDILERRNAGFPTGERGELDDRRSELESRGG